MDSERSTGSDVYMDYKGRKGDPRKHGGVRAASFVCVVEVLENMVFLSIATNLVSYFVKSMHYSAAKSSNMVTNFMGTSFLLTILGGFVADSFFTRFTTFLVSCVIELLGLILLTYQAHHSHWRPADESKSPSKSVATILYTGLYAIAIGVGGIKASLPAHGADQLDSTNHHHISSFFNWYFFSLCTGGLIAATVMVWVEENRGWNLSFMISAIVLALALCIFALPFPFYRYKCPAGSPLTRIIKVFASSARNWKASPARRVNHNDRAISESNAGEQSQDKFKFLNKALVDDTIDVSQVEETKTLLGLLPIFATTIMMNCCLAQLQTFTVQQGSIMNRKLDNFTIPTQSLSALPLLIMLASIPMFEHIKHLHTLKHLTTTNIFQPLGRMGAGLALASVSMAAAAIVEAKRREEANKNESVTLSVFWLGWQYLFLAISDALTLGGMLEFFYSKAPDSMRSMCTALSWCSTSMGYFISSVLVKISNSVSGRYGREWLVGHDLNHARLDLFYALLCILNFVNFLFYFYCARRY